MPAHRLGHITASTVSPILTGKGEKLLTGGISYARKLAMERSGLVKIDPDQYGFQGNRATEWGNENEAGALARYEAERFVDITNQQKIAQMGEWVSCTPDGYVGSDGLVEAKCPFNPDKHWEYLVDSEALISDYYDQVQFQLMCTGRAYCDLISFDPRYTAPYDLVIVRIEPDKEWIERCLSRISQVDEVIEETLNIIEASNLRGEAE